MKLSNSFLGFIVFFSIQIQAQGYLPDLTETQSTFQTTRVFRFLPLQYSLEKYCFKPQDQGKAASCVCWSACYAALTMTHIAPRGIKATDKDAFSPYYVFNELNGATGCTIKAVLNVLQTKGTLKYEEFPKDYTRAATAEDHRNAAKNKITGYQSFFNSGSRDRVIEDIKTRIAQNVPVILGLQINETFKKRGDATMWQGINDNSKTEYHTVCIIGYDDAKQAVRIINSWGTDWGDNGFRWIGYAALVKDCTAAFCLDLGTSRKMNILSDPNTELTGDVKILLKDKGAMPTAPPQYLAAFSTKKPYKTGTQFTVQAQSYSDVYIYLIGYSSNTKMVEEIPNCAFYFDAANKKIILPLDKSKIALDQYVGTDYLTILYSLEELDIKKMCQKIQDTKGDDFAQRLQTVYDDKILSKEDVVFDKENIRFTAHPRGKTLLPIILAIEHN